MGQNTILVLMEEVIEGKDYSFPAEERKVLEFWGQVDAFQEQLRRTEGQPEFVFYDGPPFATGLPHYGHLLAGSLKVPSLVECSHLRTTVKASRLYHVWRAAQQGTSKRYAATHGGGLAQDMVTRYASQTGYHVTRRFGWDTHGLPVEFEIDKANSAASKCIAPVLHACILSIIAGHCHGLGVLIQTSGHERTFSRWASTCTMKSAAAS